MTLILVKSQPIVSARRHRRHVTSGGSPGLPQGFEVTRCLTLGSIPDPVSRTGWFGVRIKPNRPDRPVGQSGLFDRFSLAQAA
jgi:hypothetical protein